MVDPKQGEREYFARIGEAGRRHSVGKPFRDDHCLDYLANLSVFMGLMGPPPAHVVEFGCGAGWLSLILAERGYDVTGIDISPDAIALAEEQRDLRELPKANFRVADYEEVAIDPPADFVIFHDALHHAESEGAALAAAYRALKPRGMVICIEPGKGHSLTTASRHAVETYGVHEKDMPPAHIFRHARAVGFKRMLVLPWPWHYLRVMFRPNYRETTSQADLFSRKLLSLWRVFKVYLRTRKQGTVILLKD